MSCPRPLNKSALKLYWEPIISWLLVLPLTAREGTTGIGTWPLIVRTLQLCPSALAINNQKCWLWSEMVFHCSYSFTPEISNYGKVRNTKFGLAGHLDQNSALHVGTFRLRDNTSSLKMKVAAICFILCKMGWSLDFFAVDNKTLRHSWVVLGLH